MPNDPYAVLRALLRAEAARSTSKPSPDTDPTAVPTTDRPKARRPRKAADHS
ncbi:hypothetical protein GCM10010145_50320 [Streptomyces ruber]|uniref:Uncharacterized protein n=2 Tax=Streptomyces TaxID=1883 RepID=A0A918BL77_9ACTN|nr:hypothetical protein [Streptomyces ruber]GGQ74551.1 hypothetical protein GCM10010145_50320 [Streptomyces ruber]